MYRTLGPYAKLKKSSINNFIDETWWKNKQTSNKTTTTTKFFIFFFCFKVEWTRVTLHTKSFEEGNHFKKHNNSNWIYALLCQFGYIEIPYHRTDRFCLFFWIWQRQIFLPFYYAAWISLCIDINFVLLFCGVEKNEAFTRQRVSRYQFSRLISISHSPQWTTTLHIINPAHFWIFICLSRMS